MGYYRRFISTSEAPVTIGDIQSAFCEADPRYRFEESEAEVLIHHGDYQLAHVTLNAPGDDLFDDEREELLEEVAEARGRGRSQVLQVLRSARQIVAVQVLHGTGDTDGTLALIGPLWSWLAKHRTGLIWADGEGCYEGNRRILAVEGAN